MISRRIIQSLLGVVWLIDGLLQLKPQMFTQSFVKDVILPTSQGQPDWISTLVNWGAHITSEHIVLLNALFAIVQLALGLAFLLNYKIRQTIIVSIIWSAFVWIFGEGLGQILTGQALILTGAPGAVLVYAWLGISVWPKKEAQAKEWRAGGIRFAQLSLAVLWAAGFVMHLQSTYLTPTGFSQAISIDWISKSIGHSGATVSVVLGLIQLGLSILFFFKINIRFAAAVSIVLSLLFWWAGQSFGQVFAPLSTDVNTGPLLVLLALCAYPRGWKVSLPQRAQNKAG